MGIKYTDKQGKGSGHESDHRVVYPYRYVRRRCLRGIAAKAGGVFIKFYAARHIGVFFINEMLTAQGADILVGINPLTALTSGILGLPGVALLYGVYLFRFL